MQLLQNAAFTRVFYLQTAGLGGIPVVAHLSKNGAAFNPADGVVTEIGSGWYTLAGTALDSDTLGPLAYTFTAAGLAPALSEPQDQVVGALTEAGRVTT